MKSSKYKLTQEQKLFLKGATKKVKLRLKKWYSLANKLLKQMEV